MKRIIVDSDNTMGVRQCDVDDGLALLFLLGNPDLCRVEALCTTYGNSSIDTVQDNTLRLSRELGMDVPVLRGAACPDEPESEAADFLASAASEEPGKLSVLATGSLTNLKGAARADSGFFSNIRELAMMGGVLKALVINGRIMDELNFSCDAEATAMALSAPCPVMDAVSQNCLPCHFSRAELASEFGAESWLMNACDNWLSTMDERYNWEGFVCWDLLAAVYLIRPDLFEDDIREVTLYPRWLEVGLLETSPMPGAPTATVNLARIRDVDAFKQEAIRSWRRALN